MRVVLDTSVLVAAIRSDAGASRCLLLGVLERKVMALASVPLMIEYEAVMMRPEHLAASGLNAEDVGVLLDGLAAVLEPVKLNFLWRPMLKDADDDMVLEAAVNGRAAAIVSFNARDFSPHAGQFGVAVQSPQEAIRILGV